MTEVESCIIRLLGLGGWFILFAVLVMYLGLGVVWTKKPWDQDHSLSLPSSNKQWL